jgi:hypothetical protein
MQLTRKMGSSGTVAARKLNAVIKAPVGYALRNRANGHYIAGWLAVLLAFGLSWFTNVFLGNRIVCIVGELSAKVRRFYDANEAAYFQHLRAEGRFDEAEEYARSRTYWIDYGNLSHHVVTDAGVTYMRDDFNNASGGADISIFNFHGMGTGANAEATGDTALQTESTTALNPDSTRATGTRSVPASNQFRSVGTLTVDADTAVTEHGLFTVSGTGSGTLWDRSKFTAINLVGASGDSIQFTYTLTLTSGG